MAHREDIVEIGGRRVAPPRAEAAADQHRARDGARKFLSVWYRCCHAYGRLERNREQTAYTGRCPRCGAAVRALIGPGGTSRRCFEADR